MVVANNECCGIVDDGRAEYFSDTNRRRVDCSLVDQRRRDNSVFGVEVYCPQLFLVKHFHFQTRELIGIPRIAYFQGVGKSLPSRDLVAFGRFINEATLKVYHEGIGKGKKTDLTWRLVIVLG